MNETTETTVSESKFARFKNHPKTQMVAATTTELGKQILFTAAVTVGATLVSGVVLKAMNQEEPKVLTADVPEPPKTIE